MFTFMYGIKVIKIVKGSLILNLHDVHGIFAILDATESHFIVNQPPIYA